MLTLSYGADRNFNPFLAGASIMDCGDVPISPYDNSLALDQIETAYTTLLARDVATDFTKGESQWHAVNRPELN